MKEKTTSVVKVPNLRFPGFSGAWVERKLGNLGEIISGLTYSPKDIDKNGVLVLRSSNVKNNNLVFEDNVFVNVTEYNNVKKDDILLVVRNGSKRLIGKCALITENCEGMAFGAFMSVFRSDLNEFLIHWFWGEDFKKEVHKNLGATINSINGSNLKKFKLFVPKLSEQTKIAEFLFLIDNRISTQIEIIEDYRRLKKGMMQKIFKQELRFKNEEGEFYLKWEEKKANKIFKNHTNKNHNSDLPILSASQREGMIYRRESGINIQSSTKSIKSYKVVEPNDFVITLRSFQGGIDFSDKIGICSPAYTILKNHIPINYSFYKFYFKKERFINRLSKTTIGIRDGKQITYENFGNLTIPYPTLAEQQKIALILSAIDSKITLETAYLDKLKAQKKYLLQNMFV